MINTVYRLKMQINLSSHFRVINLTNTPLNQYSQILLTIIKVIQKFNNLWHLTILPNNQDNHT